MDEQAFQEKLNELIARINELPEPDRARMGKLADDAKQRRERIRGSIAELQESLDFLRLSVKYLIFDLEATRRENAYLRKLVEQSAKQNSPRRNRKSDNSAESDNSQ